MSSTLTIKNIKDNLNCGYITTQTINYLKDEKTKKDT